MKKLNIQMKKNYALILICGLALIYSRINAQTVCDTLITGTSNSDWFGQCVTSNDGNIVVAGTTNFFGNWGSGDIILRKYDINLNLIWSKTFFAGGGQDNAGGVIKTSDGGYLIHSAYGNSSPAGMFSAGYIIKTDSLGNQQWLHQLVGQSYGDNYSSLAVENSNGEFICYGQVQNHAGCGGYSTRITKLSASGIELWSYCLNLPTNQRGFDKLQNSNNYVSTFNNVGTIEIRKFDDNGSQSGMVTYKYTPSTYMRTTYIKRCLTGGFYIYGSIDVTGGQDAYIAKFDNNLNFIWQHNFNKNSIDDINDIIESGTKLYLAGFAGTTASNGDMYILTTDLSGNFVSDMTFGYSTNDAALGITQLQNGDLVCSGWTDNSPIDQLMIKICMPGCTGKPVASISFYGDTTFCAGSDVLLIASPTTGVSYQWQKGGSNILGATSSTYTANTTGNFRCMVSNACGTSNSNTIHAKKLSLASASISASGSLNICAGSSVTLTVANPGPGYTYEWYRNNISINGATGLSYVAYNAGTYKIIITNIANGCSRNSGTKKVVINCRSGSLQDEHTFLSDAEINVFPNPIANTFSFDLNTDISGKGTFTLTNMLGQNVFESNCSIENGASIEENRINENIKRGLYLLRITINKKVFVSKVMIQ